MDPGVSHPPTPPSEADVWERIGQLHAHHGEVSPEGRLLKLAEETGEAAASYIGTALREAIAPLPGIIIYLDVPASTALTRARRRDQATGPGAVDVRHATELGLPTVRDRTASSSRHESSSPPRSPGRSRLGRAPGGRCA